MQRAPANTRHRRWPLLAVLAAVLLAGCQTETGNRVRIVSQAATPTAATGTPSLGVDSSAPLTPVRVSAPAGLRDLVEALLADPQLGTASVPQVVLETGGADIRVVVSAPSSRDPVVRRWSVVTAASRIDLNGVTTTTIEQSALQSRLYTATEHFDVIASLYAGPGAVTPVPADSIPHWLAGVPDSFALVPADTVTPRVRALALDGIDPVRGEGDLNAYPLVTRAAVSMARPSPAAQQIYDRLQQGLQRVEPPPIRVTFTGDLIPARCVYDAVRRLGDWTAPFRSMGDRLRSADVTVGSLDAAISGQGTPIGCRETFSLLAPPEAVQGLQAAGFDAIAVATNHVKDCGASGPCGDTTFLDTLALLRAAGIQPAGGGQNLAEARQPVVITAGGVRFAFLAYDDVARSYHATGTAPGTAPLDPETLAGDISHARTVADVVIVLPQWGEEYMPDPTERQQAIAAQAIAAGATLVVGNHPHVVQAAAPVGDGYVAYALGNFLFDQDWSQETMEGVLLETTFHGQRLAAVRFIPYRIEGRLQPVPLDGEAAQRVLQRMMKAAAALE